MREPCARIVGCGGRRVGAAAAGAVALAFVAGAIEARAQWPQFGGPDQSFRAEASGLAVQWPEGGPKKLWSREIGEGYSSIVVQDGVLYTMYRQGEEEVVCALKAEDGATLWEHRYAVAAPPGHVMEFNAGPRATPLVVDGQVIAIGVSGVMHCLEAKTGQVQWKHDLLKDYEGSVLQHGYSSSPFAYQDKVIALVGGTGHAVMAFNRKDGSVAWKQHDFNNSYCSPRLLKIEGEEHLVFGMAKEVVGLDPAGGALRWKIEFGNTFGQNILMPELLEGNILFVSAPEAGTAGYKITRTGSGYAAEEVWQTRKMQFHHVNAVRVGDYVYGSSGVGPNFFSAINAKTGELAWRERGIPKANCVYGDGHFVILDEEGNLLLATATPEKFTVLAKAPLLEKVAWTVPTLVGKTLYVRDLKHIMALDLG